LPFRKLDDLPSSPLVRTALAVRTGLVVKLALFRSGLAPGLAVRILEVFFLCQRGRNPTVAKVADGDFILVFTTPDAKAIAFFQAASGLDPAATKLDLAALDGFPGQGAGFEKPRRP